MKYHGISLLHLPQLSLVACAVCGLSVGIMWPGSFSKAAQPCLRFWHWVEIWDVPEVVLKK